MRRRYIDHIIAHIMPRFNRTRLISSRFIVGERLLFIISSSEQETHKERHEVEWHFRNSVEAAWRVHDWLNYLIETNSFYKQYITERVNHTEAESSILRGLVSDLNGWSPTNSIMPRRMIRLSLKHWRGNAEEMYMDCFNSTRRARLS